jgi:hypothetical protein
VDKESELDKIYRKISKDMGKLKEPEKNHQMDSDNGYLICKSCSGYYKLKDNEFPEDFKGCECGSPLEYRENIESLSSFQSSNSNNSTNSNYIQNDIETDYNNEYLEMQEIIDLIKLDAEERKKYLEKLQKKIRKQETLLNDIKNEKIREIKDNEWSLWNYLEDKGIENDIKEQKMIVDDYMEQENFLLSKVKERRNNRTFKAKEVLNNSYGKIAILIWIIIFLGIIGIYAIK